MTQRLPPWAVVAPATLAAAVGGPARAGASGIALAAARAGLDWLLTAADPDPAGFLRYAWDSDNGWSRTHHALREMGALWALAETAPAAGGPRHVALALRGVEYFVRQMAVALADDNRMWGYFTVTPKQIKLGYNAFIILGLLHLDHPWRDRVIRLAADGILVNQRPDGSFACYFLSDREGGADYYPGEALLALMRLHAKTGEPHLLEAVGRALPFYRTYWQGNPNTAFPHWQIQAWDAYHRATGSAEALAFLFELADWMTTRYGDGVAPPLKVGIVVAAWLEGILSGWEAAVRVGDAKRADRYRRYIDRALVNVLLHQVPPDATPEVARGGFIGSQRDLSLRVDRSQHAIVALVRAAALGLLD